MASTLALSLYLPLLAGALALVWRRPSFALYAFVVGLALHNAAMAALYAAGVRGGALSAIQAWKELLLVAAAGSVARAAWRARRLPFRPRAVDLLALAFALVVVVYALLPQRALGGAAGTEAVLLSLRSALLPVAAYGLGRALGLGSAELRRLSWTVLGTAAGLAAVGLVDQYALSVEWWRDAQVPAYFREELGFVYHGPGGMPENFAFNSADGVFRRLISTFVSPLASAFLLGIALLVTAAVVSLRRPHAVVLATLAAAGLLFTLSRSTLIALAAGFVVLALARRRAWPVGAAAATLVVGVAFASVFTSIAPRTHFFPAELAYQEAQARLRGGLPQGDGTLSLEESSIRSHLTSLRADAGDVLRHPQGYGLGNAGAVARRTGTELKAGESNYTELGAETGVLGLGLFLAWSVLLLAGLIRTARAGGDAVHGRAAAGLAASLATVLVLAVQTDAIGVPWVALCVWWLAGALVAVPPERRSLPFEGGERDRPRSGHRPRAPEGGGDRALARLLLRRARFRGDAALG
ncbi:MAG: hypothetical protein H0V40_02740 [Actinobacteria bacterium]|nr:hypothetical protein [Actinomycetota bacterium]